MTTVEVPADALVVVIAPSGAGRGTFVRRHFRPTEIVSSDRCRALVSDDEANQHATRPAFDVFHAILRGRLLLGRLSVADATNLEPAPRRGLIAMARENGRPAVALVLDVPLARARAQNLARERRVPDRVLEQHYARFAVARAALPDEGYEAVHEIRPTEAVLLVRTPPAEPTPPPEAAPG